jgi:hypothetical protein
MGKTLSSFDYKDSEGNTLNNLFGKNYNYIELGLRSLFITGKLHYNAGATLNTYGAIGSDAILGNYFEWNATYLGAKLGLDYNLYSKKFTYNSISDLSFYLKGSVATEFLVHGTQTINSQVYRLLGVEQFEYPMLFLRGGAGIDYSVTKTLIVYIQYMGGKGFPLKFGNATDNEDLKIIAHNIGFGLLLTLPAKGSCN